jgi:rod shape determining protein RodA
MTYLEYSVQRVPTGISKVLYLNWPLVVLPFAVAAVGFLMLYSVAGGSFSPWAEPQMKRFMLGAAAMFVVAMVPIWFWRNVAGLAFGVTILLCFSSSSSAQPAWARRAGSTLASCGCSPRRWPRSRW